MGSPLGKKQNKNATIWGAYFLGYKRFFSVEKIPKHLFKMIFA